MQDGLVPLTGQLAPSSDGAVAKEPPPSEPAAAARRSWWQRLTGAAPAGQAAELARLRADLREERRLRGEEVSRVRAAADRVRQAVGSLVTGYGMGLQRVERALHQHELEPIATVGQPFDPERMEVVDVVADSGRPSGEVVEEVRRGYVWNGRVFRYAQVRVAKG